jgi:acyl transferase domain-containing protein
VVGPKPAPPIAVIGMAGRFPGAADVERHWTNLVDGVESISRPAETAPEPGPPVAGERLVRAVGKVADIDLFDADYFRVPPTEAALIDPQHRLLLEVAVAAMEDSGYHGDQEAVVGVFVGCGENLYLRDFVAPTDDLAPVGTDVRILSGNEKDFLAPRIAFKLGLTGPSVTVQATCATSLTAVALACAALAAGDCDIALAGGVSLLMPDVDSYPHTPGGIFSADGRCRPFDAAASGTVPGSGAALVVLRRDDEARSHRDRRRAIIRGWAINNDGGSRAGFTTPNVVGQEAVIRAALARAGVAPDEVGYIEAHGTGTLIGDPIEFEALRRVFATGTRSERSCVLGAVKANIGHADAAAGVAGLIKAVLVVERARIPATLHFRSPNPAIDFSATPLYVSQETMDWRNAGPRVAGVSAFGLGGNNAHVVLQEASPQPVSPAARRRQIITLSARTGDQLIQMRERLARWLEERGPVTLAGLADVAFTLAVGRPQFEYRWAASVRTVGTLVEDLRRQTGPARRTGRWSLCIRGTCADIAEMGRRHAVEEPLVRAALAELTPDPAGLDGRTVVHMAVLSALAVVRALQRLGMSFGRIDAPTWATPAVTWLMGGADLQTLEAALRDCVANDDAGVAREGVGQVIVDRSFELPVSVGNAWAQGARIDWRHYFGAEPRGRVPLPAYPFSRHRYWYDRVNRRVPENATGTTRDVPQPRTEADVLRTVETVWQKVLGVETIDRDAHFIDELSGDSMYAVEIGAALSETFQVDLPVDLPFIAPTVAMAAQHIENALRDRSVSDVIRPGLVGSDDAASASEP